MKPTPEQITALVERASKLTPEQIKPIRISTGEVVRNPYTFINSHVERIQSGNKSLTPYFERLETYLNLVTNGNT